MLKVHKQVSQTFPSLASPINNCRSTNLACYSDLGHDARGLLLTDPASQARPQDPGDREENGLSSSRGHRAIRARP